jgi:hypothetical protein
LTVHFTQLVSYRCAIKEVHYGLGDGPDATLYRKVPPKTPSMRVQLTYVDGTQSPVRSFNAPK